MKKYLLTISILVILLPTIFGTTIEVSPSSISFNPKIGEQECISVNIKQSQKQELTLEDRWKNGKPSNDLGSYNLESVPLKISYNKKISEKNATQKICITPQEETKFSGVLLIISETKTAAVGVRIEVNPLEIKEKSENIKTVLISNITLLLSNIFILVSLINLQKE